jgi:threonine dehydratase
VQAHGITTVPVEEEEIEAAMRVLYERAKLACEPAGAVAVAALLSGKVPAQEDETVVCVVTGGNVSAETAAAILARQ